MNFLTNIEVHVTEGGCLSLRPSRALAMISNGDQFVYSTRDL